MLEINKYMNSQKYKNITPCCISLHYILQLLFSRLTADNHSVITHYKHFYEQHLIRYMHISINNLKTNLLVLIGSS